MAYRGEEKVVNIKRPYPKFSKYVQPWPDFNIGFSATGYHDIII